MLPSFLGNLYARGLLKYSLSTQKTRLLTHSPKLWHKMTSNIITATCVASDLSKLPMWGSVTLLGVPWYLYRYLPTYFEGSPTTRDWLAKRLAKPSCSFCRHWHWLLPLLVLTSAVIGTDYPLPTNLNKSSCVEWPMIRIHTYEFTHTNSYVIDQSYDFVLTAWFSSYLSQSK